MKKRVVEAMLYGGITLTFSLIGGYLTYDKITNPDTTTHLSNEVLKLIYHYLDIKHHNMKFDKKGEMK